METFEDFTRRATVPEHLVHYVRSLSTCRPQRLGDFLAWRAGARIILVGYPTEGAPITLPAAGSPQGHTGPLQQALDEAVARALALPGVDEITVLAPCRPGLCPDTDPAQEDLYYSLEFPVPPLSGKLANMLRRARSLVTIQTDAPWGDEHEALVASATQAMCRRSGDRRLGQDSALLFSGIGRYVAENPGKAVAYEARRRDNNALCGLAVADHASYTTAFYLFAFRTGDAPPGTADALLGALLQHAADLGQVRCNLGLGIHQGLRFFKEKWGATPAFSFAEWQWKKEKKGFFARLFGR